MIQSKILHPADFTIGMVFTNGTNLFRCTEVGSRTLIGICLNELETTTIQDGISTNTVIDPRSDVSWLRGPPYAVAEIVFDETDFDGFLRIIPEDDIQNWMPGP